MSKTSTISRKISQLTMVVSSMAVLIAAMVGIWQQYESAHKQINNQLTILAQATAFNLASPIMFGDDKEAHEALKVLKVDPEVVAARLVLPNKQILAEYHRQQQDKNSTDNGKSDKQIIADVVWKNETVGQLIMDVDLSALRAQLHLQIIFALITVVIALTLAGLLAHKFTGILTLPLRDLSELAKTVGEQGDYSMRAANNPVRDEVGQLTKRFNAMLDRIEIQDNELRKQQELLEQRVEDRTMELRQETLKAEAASRAKSEFLAVMSHEIRTPLNGILGMTNMLIDGPLDAKQKRFARVARSSGEDLLAIINDILDFSKIEAGRLDLEPRAFQINGLLEDLAERYAPIAQGKGLELLCSTPIPPISVEGDSARLAQVLTNLLSNAIKFTAQGEVMLAVELLNETADKVNLHFSVRDSGIGITEEQSTKLFTAFTQADTSMTRKYGGTGLGLAISQQLIKLMGGEIFLDSEFGEGSNFHFTLNLPKVNDVRNQQLVKGFENIRILVVDDNQTNREILEYWLNSWGAQPAMAESAPQALELLQHAANTAQPFQLLLTDWMMPDMDGGELIAAVKQDPRLENLAIVVLSSAGMASAPDSTSNTIYLLKPVRQSELHNLISSIISGDFKVNEVTHKIALEQTAKENWLPKLKGKILLAEDNLVNQEVAMAMLQRMGLPAKIANNGAEAIQLLADESFDLVLMDCHMPVMDGFEATQKIREQEMTVTQTKLPIIALTANAIIGDREHCLAKGMDDYLSKPFALEQLHKVLSQWLPLQESEENNNSNTPTITIDENVLTQLRNLKSGLLVRVIDLYIESSPKLLIDMDLALAQQDTKNLYKVAHSLKNSSSNLGVVELTNLCRDLEIKGREANLADATLLVINIKQLYTAVETELLKIKAAELNKKE